MKISIFILTLFTLIGSTIYSQAYRLVKDINEGSGSAFDVNNGYGLLATNSEKCIFIGRDKSNIPFLGGTDGTNAGTEKLIPQLRVDDKIKLPVVSNGLFWFVVVTDTSQAIYSSDGTFAGTVLRNLEKGGYIDHLKPYLNDVVYSVETGFSAELKKLSIVNTNTEITVLATCYSFGGIIDVAVMDSTIWTIGSLETKSDRWLFKSNGKAGGRTDVAFLNAGSEFNNTVYLTPVGNKLFFFWNKNGDTGRKLWVSDGTASGTQGLLLIETPSFADYIKQRAIIPFENKFFFQARQANDNYGYELWVSDGTIAGTKLSKDFNTGTGAGNPKNLTIYKDKLYVVALNSYYNSEIYVYDSNQKVFNRAFPKFLRNEYHGTDLIVFNDSLAFGGYRKDVGGELMMANNANDSVSIITDGSLPDDNQFYPYDLMASKNKLFFIANKSEFGKELWVYLPKGIVISTSNTANNSMPLNVFPNPTHDNLYIEFKEFEEMPSEIEILNINGSKVTFVDIQIQGISISLNTCDLNPGIYLLVLNYKNGTHRSKIFMKI